MRRIRPPKVKLIFDALANNDGEPLASLPSLYTPSSIHIAKVKFWRREKRWYVHAEERRLSWIYGSERPKRKCSLIWRNFLLHLSLSKYTILPWAIACKRIHRRNIFILTCRWINRQQSLGCYKLWPFAAWKVRSCGRIYQCKDDEDGERNLQHFNWRTFSLLLAGKLRHLRWQDFVRLFAGLSRSVGTYFDTEE